MTGPLGRISPMKIYTIGFTKKNAESFFETLRNSGARRVIDVRIHNVSQLSGFSKRDDLAYFCRTVLGIDYLHMPELGPTDELFDAYKKKGGAWKDYERAFNALLKTRAIEKYLDKKEFDGACLLCTEDWPDHCHRRLVAEYLAERWEEVEVEHLV